MARVQLRLEPGEAFTPEKCGLCGSKAPPHPAHLIIEREDGTGNSFVTLCAKCDEATTKLAKLVGTGAAAFRVGTKPGGTAQTEMRFGGDDAGDAGDDPPDDPGDDGGGGGGGGGGPGPDDDPEPPYFPTGPTGGALPAPDEADYQTVPALGAGITEADLAEIDRASDQRRERRARALAAAGPEAP